MLRLILLALGFFTLLGCRHYAEETTGWDYNNPKNGGFQKAPYFEQETPAGMTLVEGGDYLLYFGDQSSDSLNINSFYISKYEETNGQYLAYLTFLKKYYSFTTYQAALPDTSVWMNDQIHPSTGEYLMQHYLRSNEYQYYPVVGLTPNQIKKYASWKTDRMNEYILIREGVIQKDYPISDSLDVFTTERYYSGQWEEPRPVSNINNLNPKHLGERTVRFEDGILMPRFRMVTEQEWVFAQAAIGDTNNKYVKTPKADNFKRYDKEGSFFYLNDLKNEIGRTPASFLIIASGIKRAIDFEPNNYNIYGMYENVSEIVGDSTSFVFIGGSFLGSVEKNTAIHDSENRIKLLYPLEQGKPIQENTAGLYGFRLGMDRIGGTQYNDRVKVK